MLPQTFTPRSVFDPFQSNDIARPGSDCRSTPPTTSMNIGNVTDGYSTNLGKFTDGTFIDAGHVMDGYTLDEATATPYQPYILATTNVLASGREPIFFDNNYVSLDNNDGFVTTDGEIIASQSIDHVLRDSTASPAIPMNANLPSTPTNGAAQDRIGAPLEIDNSSTSTNISLNWSSSLKLSGVLCSFQEVQPNEDTPPSLVLFSPGGLQNIREVDTSYPTPADSYIVSNVVVGRSSSEYILKDQSQTDAVATNECQPSGGLDTSDMYGGTDQLDLVDLDDDTFNRILDEVRKATANVKRED